MKQKVAFVNAFDTFLREFDFEDNLRLGVLSCTFSGNIISD